MYHLKAMAVSCSSNFGLILSVMMERLLLVSHACVAMFCHLTPNRGSCFHTALHVARHTQTSLINSHETPAVSGTSAELYRARLGE